MANNVRAGNMLNSIITSNERLYVRAAVWIAYYPLVIALTKLLDRFERTIEKRYEPIEKDEPPGWQQADRVE